MKNNPTRAQLNNDFSSCYYWMHGQLLYVLAQIIFFWEFMLELHYYLEVPVLLPIYYHCIICPSTYQNQVVQMKL